METKDIMLAKAKFKDWESIYHSVWSRPETAQYMQWQITESEEAAKERMQKQLLTRKFMIHIWYTKKRVVKPLGLLGLRK